MVASHAAISGRNVGGGTGWA